MFTWNQLLLFCGQNAGVFNNEGGDRNSPRGAESLSRFAVQPCFIRTLESVVFLSRNFVVNIYLHRQLSATYELPFSLILIFMPCILFFLQIINKCTEFFSNLLFYSDAPTCFDTCVPSSGSSYVPAELHENQMQWLIDSALYVMWRPGVHRSVHTRPTHRHISTYNAESYQPLHSIVM
jgi:hypothetical protein